MWVFRFYRFYLSVVGGIGASLCVIHSWWFGLAVALVIRISWAVVEHLISRYNINRSFKKHAYTFKQLTGPYGIRLINKAEKDHHLRTQLAEVFVDDERQLRKALENIEVMDTLFKAGMRPDGDTWQLHDLKLKYARFRLEEMAKQKDTGGTMPVS